MRLALALGLALSPATLLAAAKNPDTYTYLTISSIDSLDPAWSYDTSSSNIILNVYETLVAYDKDSVEKLVPLVASKVPSTANGLIRDRGRTYIFPIRKGLKFHDGTPLTPEDVKYSILRFMLYDRDGGPSSLLLEPLTRLPSTRDDKGNLRDNAFALADKAVSVEGDKVVLHLPAPFAPILTILAQWGPIVSKPWCAAHGEWDGTGAAWKQFNNFKKQSSYLYEHMNGTGPWKLARWDKNNQEVVLDRNEAYWRGPAKLAHVMVKGVDDLNVRKLRLEAGDADAIYADWPSYSQVANVPGVQIIDNLSTVEMNPVIFFIFDINPVANPDIGSGKLDGDGIPHDFFADKDVRKGFAYAFDYAGFIRDVERGHGTQATGFIPKSLPGYDPSNPVYAYDPAKAAEHLKKAWGGKVWDKGFRFTLTFNSGNEPRQTVSQMIKRSIESLNPKFRIDVRPVQWPTFLDAQNAHKLPMFVMGWQADYPDPHNFAFPMMHEKGIFPQDQRWSNPEATRLVEEGLRETSMAKRKLIYKKLLRLAYEEVPHLVLVDAVRYRTQRDWVKGWYHNAIFPDSPWGSYYYPISKD